jgi:hypothetical protein
LRQVGQVDEGGEVSVRKTVPCETERHSRSNHILCVRKKNLQVRIEIGRGKFYFSANIKILTVKANSSAIIKPGSNHGSLPPDRVWNWRISFRQSVGAPPKGASGALLVLLLFLKKKSTVVIPKKLANLLKFRLRRRPLISGSSTAVVFFFCVRRNRKRSAHWPAS